MGGFGAVPADLKADRFGLIYHGEHAGHGEMLASSRTPEGLPSRCVLCGAENDIDFSATGGDPPCPNWGELLIRTSQKAELSYDEIATILGVDRAVLADDEGFVSKEFDSLDTVEIVMAIEEHTDVNIPPNELETTPSLHDLVTLIIKHSNSSQSNN